ncbi:hypothetical protein ABMA28_015798 [Loxostege sticticalis]|uniref:Carboxylic ester hydrolase n=1 Tax=Loxostege sticticalis TaxID=481309 RepID=A0ABD0TB37_LOXSC
MWRVTVLYCAFIVATVLSQGTVEDSRVVNLNQGSFRGLKSSDYNVFQFLNIPYASAPTGADRFKAPGPPPQWSGINDAIDRRIVCPQVSTLLHSMLVIQEDCLVANIYVPNTVQTNLPVLVLVHGGAYMLGWGSMDQPNELVSSKNIIVVTFNYRLGAHGFLCLGTEDAPGNAGMKDQVALLRWVRDNIAEFGGNPNDVTISGCSAGGSSVDLLMLSNMTNGLFNKVISESGCSVNLFSAQLNPVQNARDFALKLGFTDVMNLNALTRFYTDRGILGLFDESLLFAKDSYLIFQPCVENDLGQERFLADAPENILISGDFKKLPVIYGYAKQEGIFRLPQFNEWSVEMNENFTNFLPADLHFDNETQKAEVARQVQNFYFQDRLVNDITVSEYIDYFTDAMFLVGILRNIPLRVRAGHTQIYLYEYSFTHSGSEVIPQLNGIRGATHCDQYLILFDHPSPSEERLNMALTMREIIYNFITTGNPTPPGSGSSLPTWPQVGVDRSPHYSVGSTIEVAGIPVRERAELWDDLYARYGATPQPPMLDDFVNTTTPDYEEETTTPEPNSATLNNVFSYKFWIVYTTVILIALK